jgi:hypothetical protein
LQNARYELDEELCPLAQLQNPKRILSYNIWNELHFETFLKFLRGPSLFEKI